MPFPLPVRSNEHVTPLSIVDIGHGAYVLESVTAIVELVGSEDVCQHCFCYVDVKWPSRLHATQDKTSSLERMSSGSPSADVCHESANATPEICQEMHSTEMHSTTLVRRFG
ncbi:hypothetical protein GQR58_008230 [Nymphon striatum]|nr:hypothetical protein GQR58_008230 [Nymphon striatum]